MWLMVQSWDCIPELSQNCMDMTNSSSMYFGIIIGTIIAAIISWWVFNRQKKTSDKQDYTLNRIEQLEKYNEKLLEKILELNKKMILFLSINELGNKLFYLDSGSVLSSISLCFFRNK